MSAVMAIYLGPGDRVLVEVSGVDPFEATVKMPLGWGLVNGSIDLAMRKDDGSEFTYRIRYDEPVTLIVGAKS